MTQTGFPIVIRNGAASLEIGQRGFIQSGETGDMIAGNRLFELALGPVALAFCGSSDASQSLIDDLLEHHGPDGFAAAMLRARGLDWAADLLADFPDGEPAGTDPLNPQQKELFS